MSTLIRHCDASSRDTGGPISTSFPTEPARDARNTAPFRRGSTTASRRNPSPLPSTASCKPAAATNQRY
jgi:hypothetical protein